MIDGVYVIRCVGGDVFCGWVASLPLSSLGGGEVDFCGWVHSLSYIGHSLIIYNKDN